MFERHRKVESELWACCDRLYRIAPGTKRYGVGFRVFTRRQTLVTTW
jgi:hypothetical protein